MRLMKTLIAGASATVLAAGAAEAQTKYAISGWAPPTHVFTKEIHHAFADAVRAKTNGKINFEVFASGALLPPLSTMQGVRDGVAQAGHVAAPYHPSEFPINNLVGDIGHNVGDPLVLAAAYLDYSVNDPDGAGEWKRNGNLPITVVSTGLNRYFCRMPVKTLADLKGKRVRIPGGGWARVGEHLGVVPVNLPFTEIYTAMERGAVDCVMTDATNLTSGVTIIDLTKSALMIPFQPGYNTSQLALNIPFWKGLTNDERRLLLNEAAVVMAKTHIVFDMQEKESLAAAKAKGVEINEPDATIKEAYKKWVEGGFGGVAANAKERLRIADPEKHMATFNGYLTKWAGLLKDTKRDDANAVLAVLKTNLFDKIDVTKYGMN